MNDSNWYVDLYEYLPNGETLIHDGEPVWTEEQADELAKMFESITQYQSRTGEAV